MAWQDYADKHVNTPVVCVSIAFNSGTRYYSDEYIRHSSGGGKYSTFKYGSGPKYGSCEGLGGYKGKILSFPEIKSSIGDIERTYERNKITIIFDDTDYEFRGLEQTESVSLKNRTVVIKIAFKEDDYASPLTVFTGYIYDWDRLDDLQFRIEVEERSLNMENRYPNKKVEKTDYANADDTAIGWTIPVPYGTIEHPDGAAGNGAFGHPSLSTEGHGTGLPFVDTTVDAEKHIVGLQTAAITVTRVFKNGVLQTEGGGNDYQITTSVVDGKTHTLISWEAANNPTADDLISCDVVFGSRTPVEAIRHFLENFCGYTYATDFNATSYTTALSKESDRSYTFDGTLWEVKTLRTILDEWRDELELDIYWDKDGLLCFNYLTSALPASPNEYNDLNDILAGFESNPKVMEIINKMVYRYNFNFSKTYFHNNPTYEDTDSQTKYGAVYEKSGGQKFYWIRSATMALDLASRKIIRRKDPIVFDAFNFPLKTFSDDLTDILKITHFEGIGSSGYNDKYFQVRELLFDIDQFVNTALLEDASSFFGKSCILGDSSVLPAAWTGASGAQRDYCYLCDSGTGQFSDGEPGKRLFD